MKIEKTQNYNTNFGAKIVLNEPMQCAMRYVKNAQNVSDELRRDYYRALKYIHFNEGMKNFSVKPLGKNFEIETVENINLHYNPTNVFKTKQQTNTNSRGYNIVQDIINYAKQRFAKNAPCTLCGKTFKFEEEIQIPKNLEKSYGKHIENLLKENKSKYMFS